MKAAVMRANNAPLEIENVQIDDPGPGEVLLKTAASGICHSDLTVMEGGLPVPPPCVLGHEPAGIVETVGEGVTDFAPGDHVIGCLNSWCGVCKFCTGGRPYLCPSQYAPRDAALGPRLTRGGETIDQFANLSSFAEKMLCPERSLVKIRDDMPLAQAALIGCGVTTGLGAALNTVNIGKYNLGWASIGISTHAFYEAVTHAHNRVLYGQRVTEFPQVRRLMMDAYARLVAMKLVGLRAADYMRAAGPDDRRYLLFSPIVKMKVTTQGEDVINHLWDVIAARGFENDTYFETAARDIRALPKLEGTVHVNMALIVKFMANYLFNPAEFPEIGRRDDDSNDDFLFQQGATRGLAGIQFHDPMPVFERHSKLPNVALFIEQIETMKELCLKAAPTKEQSRNVDFLLAVGELFTVVVYAQLLLENAPVYSIPDALVEQIFDVLLRDMSRYAIDLYNNPAASDEQMKYCLKLLRKPVADAARFDGLYTDQVVALAGAYEMRP